MMIAHHLLMGVVTLLPLALLGYAGVSVWRKLGLIRRGERATGRALWVWREEEALGGGAGDGEDHVVLAFKDASGRENRIRKLGVSWYLGVRKRGDNVGLIYPPNQPSRALLARPLYLWGGELCAALFAASIVLARVATGV
jgi:hypothetical protein